MARSTTSSEHTESAGGGSIPEAKLTSAEDDIVLVSQGWRVRRTAEWTIEVWAMLYNWRLVVYRTGSTTTVEKGYCFMGRGLDSLTRAVAAGREWHDPLNSDPPDWDKRAFPDPAWRHEETQ